MPSKSLTVTWKGDIADLEAKAALVEATIKKTGGTVAQVSQQQGSAFGALSNALTSFSPRLAAVGGQLESVGSKVNSVTGSAGGLSAELGGVGVAAVAAGVGLVAAGGAVAGFALKGVTDLQHLAAEVYKVQQVMGGTAEQVSLLVAQGAALGVSADDIATSMRKASQNVNDHADALAADGIIIQRTAAGHTDMAGTLQSVGDAYKATEDPAKRAALAQQVFGRGWQSMAPILASSKELLAKLGEEADKHHEIINDEQITKARQLTIEQRELGMSVRGVGMEIGSGIVPALTDLTIGLTKVIDNVDHAAKKHSWFATALSDVGKALFLLPAALATFGHGSKEAAKAQADLADEEQKAINAMVVEAQATEAASVALDKVKNAVLGDIAAHKAQRDALARVADDTQNLADKQKVLADLRAKSLVDQKAVDQALDNEAQAARRLRDANESLAAVQERWNDVQQRSGQYAEDLAHANLAVEHSDLARVDSQRRVLDITKELAAAFAQHDTTKMVDLQGQLEQAHLGVKEATQASTDAKAREQTLLNQAIPGTEEYTNLQRDLRNAKEGVTDAEHAQTDAHAAVVIAEQGDLKRAGDIAAAVRDVSKAELTLRDDRDNAAIATMKTLDADKAKAAVLLENGSAAGKFHHELDDLFGAMPGYGDVWKAFTDQLVTPPSAYGGAAPPSERGNFLGNPVAGAGTVATNHVTVNINAGTLVHQDDVHQVIVNGIQQYIRNNGPAGF